jgi:hypothetical protein
VTRCISAACNRISSAEIGFAMSHLLQSHVASHRFQGKPRAMIEGPRNCRKSGI